LLLSFVYGQSIHPDDTYATLSARLSQLGAELLVSTLQNLSQYRSESQIQHGLSSPPSTPTDAATGAASSTSDTATSSYARPEAILLSMNGRAPRFVKNQGELHFKLFNSSDLYNLYRGFSGFLPLFSYLITHTSTNKITHLRCTFHKLITQREADKRRRDLASTPTARPKNKHKALSASLYPSQSHAHALGAGSIWYDAELELIGVHCAAAPTSTQLTTLYVEMIQPEYKSQMHAYDFAKSYLALQLEDSSNSKKKKDAHTTATTTTTTTATEIKHEVITRQFSFGPAPAK
jgi:methionyl-tRNA formyltransferase